MPPLSANKLKFNKELFKTQTYWLYRANIFFGLLAMVTISFGTYFMMTENDFLTSTHIICLNGNEWGYLDTWG